MVDSGIADEVTETDRILDNLIHEIDDFYEEHRSYANEFL